MSQKDVPTFKLSVTLSNLNRFTKFCTAAKRMKFATKPIYDITHLTLGMSLLYLGKLIADNSGHYSVVVVIVDSCTERCAS